MDAEMAAIVPVFKGKYDNGQQRISVNLFSV